MSEVRGACCLTPGAGLGSAGLLTAVGLIPGLGPPGPPGLAGIRGLVSLGGLVYALLTGACLGYRESSYCTKLTLSIFLREKVEI